MRENADQNNSEYGHFSRRTSNLICTTNQMTGFYMKCNTGQKWVRKVFTVSLDEAIKCYHELWMLCMIKCLKGYLIKFLTKLFIFFGIVGYMRILRTRKKLKHLVVKICR